MKNLMIATIAVMSLMALKANAQSFACIYKDVEHSKIRYVHPVYNINVNYMFDKSTREAYALANWQFDVEKTRDCFEAGREKYPNSELMVPPISVSQVQLKILGSKEFFYLDTYPMANGHWSASTRMIPIPYSAKEMIVDAIEKELSVAEFMGDPRMRITIIERKPVGIVKCTNKEEEAGVMNLFKRLKEVKETAETMTLSAGVKPEEALQNFLGKCVEFNHVNAESFTEFDKEQRINSKIIKGEFSLMGYKPKDSYLEMRGFLGQNAIVQDL